MVRNQRRTERGDSRAHVRMHVCMSNPAPGTYGDVTQTGFAVRQLADGSCVYEFEPHASPLILFCRPMDEDTRLRTLGCEFEIREGRALRFTRGGAAC